MEVRTQVQVHACADRLRVMIGTVPLGELIEQLITSIPAHEIEQFRADLSVMGKATLKGQEGRWREYQIIKRLGE